MTSLYFVIGLVFALGTDINGNHIFHTMFQRACSDAVEGIALKIFSGGKILDPHPLPPPLLQ